MESKFFDSLYDGDSSMGVMLCMGLTGGDFWARLAGSQNLYRGSTPKTVDFENLIVVADIAASSIFVPTFVAHDPLGSYHYVLRRANCCGNEDYTLSAAVRVSFDAAGDLIEAGPNRVFSVKAQQIGPDKIRLVWFYWPINQKKIIEQFRVYSNAGSGQIDYENSIATVTYYGRGFYSYQVSGLSGDTHRLCIKAVSANGIESVSAGIVQIQLNTQKPNSVTLLQAEAV